MNSKNTSTECPECEIGSLTRNNYFTGKLLVERDFKDEQRYYMDKLRLHQKRLHGEGVVCGLEVKEHSNQACRGRYLCIDPGFAKDCCGNDIIVPQQECIDITQFKSWTKLRAAQKTQAGGAGAPGIGSSHTLQICVRYRECPTENIPVLYDDCGCDDTACAPNRILESYAFDLLVDPEIKVKRGCLPNLVTGKALNGVTPGWLAFDPNDTYLYALSSATPATVNQMDPTGQTVRASYALAGAGKAIAVSDDGTRVYAVSYDAGTNQSSLVVLNASGLTLVGTSAAIADDTSPASLAALPSSHVAWLQSTGKQLLVWDATVAIPAQTQAIALQGSPVGLALGGDRTKAYYIDSANKQVGAIDIAASAMLPPLTLVPNPAQVLLASASGPDILAVIDSTNATITALQARPAAEVAIIVLLDQPLASAADLRKKVLYVVTAQTPVGYELQPFDLKKLVAGSPELPPAGVASVQPASATSVVTDGHSIFVIPAAASANNPTQSFQIDAPRCPELYELEECEDCCKADCLVLATIRGYQPGFVMEDPETPPTDPIADYGNQISRIDNKLGRVILPSTRKIAEVLESLVCGCACDCQPQTVTAPAPAAPVIGLNPDLPKIIDIGWANAATVDWLQLSSTWFVPFGQINVQELPVMTIYFNQVMAGVDRQSFRVEITYPEMVSGPQSPAGEFTFTGFTQRIQVYGYLVDIVPMGITTTPHTAETPKSAWAFIPYAEFWESLLLAHPWRGVFYKNPPWPALDPPCARITLAGDFIYAGPNYAESGVLDGDNIGGQVGINKSRGGAITGGKNPSGDMLEGGTFESWFYLGQPPDNDL